MTRKDHLLVIIMEECAEIAQAASKALRFGLMVAPPGTNVDTNNNAVRMKVELVELNTVFKMLCAESDELNGMNMMVDSNHQAFVDAKIARVEEFLRCSAEREGDCAHD